MTDVLSQDEIDLLLGAISAADGDTDAIEPAGSGKKCKIYDFKRPDVFTKDSIRTVCIIHEVFARKITETLSSYLKKQIHVHVAAVDQLTYEEFTRSIPTPSPMVTIKLEGLKGKALFEIDPAVTSFMLNCLFGGQGKAESGRHEITVLEQKAIVDIANACLFEPLREAWEKIIDIKPEFLRIETDPSFAHATYNSSAAHPSDMVVLVCFECRFGDEEGMINLCIPHSSLEPVMNKLNTLYYYSGIPPRSKKPLPDLFATALDKVKIPVTVQIGQELLTLKEIKELEEGSILELDKLAGEPVDVFAGGVLIGKGEVVVIDENFGVRITDIAGAGNE